MASANGFQTRLDRFGKNYNAIKKMIERKRASGTRTHARNFTLKELRRAYRLGPGHPIVTLEEVLAQFASQRQLLSSRTRLAALYPTEAGGDITCNIELQTKGYERGTEVPTYLEAIWAILKKTILQKHHAEGFGVLTLNNFLITAHDHDSLVRMKSIVDGDPDRGSLQGVLSYAIGVITPDLYGIKTLAAQHGLSGKSFDYKVCNYMPLMPSESLFNHSFESSIDSLPECIATPSEEFMNRVFPKFVAEGITTLDIPNRDMTRHLCNACKKYGLGVVICFMLQRSRMEFLYKNKQFLTPRSGETPFAALLRQSEEESLIPRDFLERIQILEVYRFAMEFDIPITYKADNVQYAVTVSEQIKAGLNGGSFLDVSVPSRTYREKAISVVRSDGY
jgi:hypothetical protein